MSKSQERFELVQTPDQDLVFVKVFDLEQQNARLSILMLERDQKWTMKATTQSILMFSKEDLVRYASRAKFGSISLYGKLDGSPFKGEDSDQLIAVFRK